jgi:hypothetical protein
MVCFNTKSWYLKGIRKIINIFSEEPVSKPRLETGTY